MELAVYSLNLDRLQGPFDTYSYGIGLLVTYIHLEAIHILLTSSTCAPA